MPSKKVTDSPIQWGHIPMSRDKLYSRWSCLMPIEDGNMTYSVDKLTFTMNCGTNSGREKDVEHVLHVFCANGYSCKKVTAKYPKFSLMSRDGLTHVQIWVESSPFRCVSEDICDDGSIERSVTSLSTPCMKVRWEFNPNKVHDVPICLIDLGRWVRERRPDGVCPVALNRVDYALDLVGVPTESLIVLTRKKRCDTKLTTRYFGRRGTEELKVYDKSAESNLSGPVVTRLEWESYNYPLFFRAKEELCLYTDELPSVYKHLIPAHISLYLAELNPRTKKKHLDIMRKSSITIDNSHFAQLSSDVHYFLTQTCLLDTTSDLRSFTGDDNDDVTLFSTVLSPLDDMKNDLATLSLKT